MKKKIEELYNKPVVVGNPNEVTKNEIHISKVNVPTSGGGGSASGEDNLIYYDVTSVAERDYNSLESLSPVYMKVKDGIYGGINKSALTDFKQGILAVALVKNSMIANGSVVTTKEAFQNIGISLDSIFTEITKEEFYTL